MDLRQFITRNMGGTKLVIIKHVAKKNCNLKRPSAVAIETKQSKTLKVTQLLQDLDNDLPHLLAYCTGLSPALGIRSRVRVALYLEHWMTVFWWLEQM